MSEGDNQPISATAVDFDMDGPDSSDEPNLNTGTPWSTWEDQDIRWGLDHNRSIEETADFLCRTPSEVRQRIAEIAEAGAIGDPSLMRDRLTDRDRIALETYRDACTAMALIREAVEDCAPPGSVTREGYLTPEFTVQAEALVRGIYAIAGRYRTIFYFRSCTPTSAFTTLTENIVTPTNMAVIINMYIPTANRKYRRLVSFSSGTMLISMHITFPWR